MGAGAGRTTTSIRFGQEYGGGIVRRRHWSCAQWIVNARRRESAGSATADAINRAESECARAAYEPHNRVSIRLSTGNPFPQNGGDTPPFWALPHRSRIPPVWFHESMWHPGTWIETVHDVINTFTLSSQPCNFGRHAAVNRAGRSEPLRNRSAFSTVQLYSTLNALTKNKPV